jgi:hypothetical protein
MCSLIACHRVHEHAYAEVAAEVAMDRPPVSGPLIGSFTDAWAYLPEAGLDERRSRGRASCLMASREPHSRVLPGRCLYAVPTRPILSTTSRCVTC